MQYQNRYTVEALTKKLKLNALLPRNQSTFSDADYAAILSSEFLQTVVPWIVAQKVELFTTYCDVEAINQVNIYPLPVRATGTKLKEVTWVFPNDGNNVQQPVLSHIPMISVENTSAWAWSQSASAGFYIQGNNLIMYPVPTATQIFRMYYYRRPNQLVQQKEGAFITNVSGNTLTLSNIPAGQYVWTVGDTVDVIRPNPPFDTIVEDAVITGVNNYEYTLNTVTGIQYTVEIGDTIALANLAIVPQIPVDMHELLVQAAVVKILIAVGDMNKYKVATQDLGVLKDNIFNSINPRVDADPPRIVGGNGIRLYNRPGFPWRNT